MSRAGSAACQAGSTACRRAVPAGSAARQRAGRTRPAATRERRGAGANLSTMALPDWRSEPAATLSASGITGAASHSQLQSVTEVPNCRAALQVSPWITLTICRVGAECRRCVFWELDPVGQARALESGESALEKEAWVSGVLLQWGSCGKIIYVDGVAAGFVLYAPPQYVPRSLAFPTSPVSADAALLMTAHILAEFSGGGLGRMLVQGVVKDMSRRGIRAVEAFGDAGSGFQDSAPPHSLSEAAP